MDLSIRFGIRIGIIRYLILFDYASDLLPNKNFKYVKKIETLMKNIDE